MWCSDGERWYCAGKLPLDSVSQPIEQRLTNDGHGVETVMQTGKLNWRFCISSLGSDTGDYRGLCYRVRATEPCDAKLALAIRPMEMDGAHPIFNLNRRNDGMWLVDGSPFVVSEPAGRMSLVSSYGEPDVWKQCQQLEGKLPLVSQVEATCSVGQCSGVELHQSTLAAGELLSAMAVVYPSQTVSSIRRSSPSSLWRGAIEERRTLLSLGSSVELSHHQALFERVQHRLLSEVGELYYEGCLAALCSDDWDLFKSQVNAWENGLDLYM